jgi:hypothetical protein
MLNTPEAGERRRCSNSHPALESKCLIR